MYISYFPCFYQQYLILFAVVPRKISIRTWYVFIPSDVPELLKKKTRLVCLVHGMMGIGVPFPSVSERVFSSKKTAWYLLPGTCYAIGGVRRHPPPSALWRTDMSAMLVNYSGCWLSLGKNIVSRDVQNVYHGIYIYISFRDRALRPEDSAGKFLSTPQRLSPKRRGVSSIWVWSRNDDAPVILVNAFLELLRSRGPEKRNHYVEIRRFTGFCRFKIWPADSLRLSRFWSAIGA